MIDLKSYFDRFVNDEFPPSYVIVAVDVDGDYELRTVLIGDVHTLIGDYDLGGFFNECPIIVPKQK